MQSIVLNVVACLLKAGAAVFGLFPVRRRVVLMSRQSSKPSQDFCLLAEALRKRFPYLEVQMCVTEPEIKAKAQFAGNTVRQLKWARTSSVVVLDGYIPAVSVPKPRPGVTVIQLWHAMGAIKRFGYQCLDTPDGRSSTSARVLRMHRNYDWIVVGGPWAVNDLAAAFDAPVEKVLPLGLPRLDYLCAPAFEGQRDEMRTRILGEFPLLANGRKNVVYAPTFRRNDFSFGMHELQQALEFVGDFPFNFVYAGHPLEDEGDPLCLPENTLADTGFRTIDLLLVADCVITDYSAIAYEAAALGVPVFFSVSDIEEYRISPGLNVDPLADYPECSFENLKRTLKRIKAYFGLNACASCENAPTCSKRKPLPRTTFNESLGEFPTQCLDSIVDLIGENL